MNEFSSCQVQRSQRAEVTRTPQGTVMQFVLLSASPVTLLSHQQQPTTQRMICRAR
jgi:hypothetical protein